MIERVFLGWDGPFLPRLVDRLLENRDSLSTSLVVVPTSQSGRLLREALAASAAALLAPQVTTPGALLHLDDPTVAPPWLERLAWTEILESVKNWEPYSELFPTPPAENTDWATSFAAEITNLRASLQDHLLDLRSASKLLQTTPERGRWNALARLELLAEKQLADWSHASRSSALQNRFALPPGYTKIILAGLTETPPCLAAALLDSPAAIIAYIAAPPSEHENFSELGIPTESWNVRKLSLTDPHVHPEVVADPACQAQAALQAIAATGASSDRIALASADDSVGSALSSLLARHGWPAFHPAARPPLPGLPRWLRAWNDWLANDSAKNLAALLSLPESSPLVSGYRAQKLDLLNDLRDRNPVIETETLLQLLHNSADKSKQTLHAAISKLLAMRDDFLDRDFPASCSALLDQLKPHDERSVQIAGQIHDWLENASPIIAKLRRSHLFWLQTLLGEIPRPAPVPPQERALDIQGWLELLYEPGPHLVICGMNEGLVPARSGGEPWLSETIRSALGLGSEKNRHARDAYLLEAMLNMRADHGSVHLICGKTGSGGLTYLPSRLLLQVEREQLVPAVTRLFREIEPPEANLVRQTDWLWQASDFPTPQRLSLTALPGYLACPFRFYLRYIAGMSEPAPDRREMHERDFGSLVHQIVENWGNHPEARHLAEADELAVFLSQNLDETVLERFGKKPPISIRIQAESARQRLIWFAKIQAEMRAEGWEIIDVEKKIIIPSNGIDIVGKIDRIDRNAHTGELRVIDYKTGKVITCEEAHRVKLTARNRPAHLADDCPALQDGEIGYLWKNLQLPLYALATLESGLAIPSYIHLGKTEEHIKATTWDGFTRDDLETARSCADWITLAITERRFWPPSPKVPYDDFELLTHTQPLELAAKPPSDCRDPSQLSQ